MATKEGTISNEVTNEDGSLRVADLLLGAGFGFMLAWHYLVLFSPVFGDLNGEGTFSYLFERQLVLYISLAVTFGLIWLRGVPKKQDKERRHNPSVRLVIIVGLLSVVVSALYAVVSSLGSPLPIRLSFVAGLGICEAFLMFLWLRCFVNKRSEHFLRSFAIDMVVGGLLALIICCFQWPIGPVVASLAPGLSALVLAREARLSHVQYQSQKESLEEKTKDPEIGAEAAYPAEEDNRQKTGQDSLISRRNRLMTLFAAVYALAFGLMQGAFIAAGIPLLIVTNAVALLGIVVAGSVIYIIPDKLGPVLGIDIMHRVSLIMFVLGAVIISWFSLGDAWLIISQIAMLAGFNLFDFGVLVYGIEENRSRQNKDVHVVDRARPVVYLCMTAGLLLGNFIIQGVVLEDQLFILTVICGTSIIVLVATTLMPFYNLKESEEPTSQENADKPQLMNYSHAMLSTPVMVPSAAFDLARHEVPEDWESPWRKACNDISKRYQLSPRETEIFFLVAKGRNADYIQQKLVISTHTAKTHIANIYRKLEVHSSQELLDLVEETRGHEEK